MASFVLRKIDDHLWKRVKVKAATEGVSIKSVLVSLIEGWANEDRPATPRRKRKETAA